MLIDLLLSTVFSVKVFSVTEGNVYPCPFVNIQVNTCFIIQAFQVFPIPVKIWGHQKVRRQIDLVSERGQREYKHIVHISY